MNSRLCRRHINNETSRTREYPALGFEDLSVAKLMRAMERALGLDLP